MVCLTSLIGATGPGVNYKGITRGRFSCLQSSILKHQLKGTLRKLEGAFNFFELTVLVLFLIQPLQQLAQHHRSYWYPLQNLLALLWHQMRCPLPLQGPQIRS